MLSEISVDDLFLPIMDLLDQKKTMSRAAMVREMRIEFPQVEQDGLDSSVHFCLDKLMEAELIEEISSTIRLTAKGKKVLISDGNELGLREIEFYASHGENFFGKPLAGLKPKTLFSRMSNVKGQQWSIVIVIICALVAVGYYVNLGISTVSDKAISNTLGDLPAETETLLKEAKE